MERKHKVVVGEELKKKLKEEKFAVTQFMGSEDCFHASDITVNGIKTPILSRSFKQPRTDRLEGIHCPDCGAQGYRTDNDNVAVCGAYPGWYFYYLLEYEDEDIKPKFKLKLVGGEMVQVADHEPKKQKGLK